MAATTDVIDVPSLSSFGSFCSRSLQAEDIIVLGSASAHKSRIFMGGLYAPATSSANVYTVLESKCVDASQSQKSAFVIKMNQGSDNLVVTHETLRLDANGNLSIFDADNESLFAVNSTSKTLQCENATFTNQLLVQNVDIHAELASAKQDIEDLKTLVAQLQAQLV